MYKQTINQFIMGPLKITCINLDPSMDEQIYAQ